MSIFKIEDDELVLDKEEARMIPAFKDIIVRDKGGKIVGDSNGRKKYYALAELMYLYLVHNPKSMYRDAGEKERRMRAKKHVALEDEWVMDDKMVLAEKAYIKSLSLSATHQAVINAGRALYSIGKDIDLFNEQKNKLRAKLVVIQDKIDTTTDKVELKDLMEMENNLTTRLMAITKNIQIIIEKLTSNFETLKALEIKLAKEENAHKQEIRGGGVLANREEA